MTEKEQHYHMRTMRCPDCKQPLYSQFWCSVCNREIDQATGKTTHHTDFPHIHPRRKTGKMDDTP